MSNAETNVLDQLEDSFDTASLGSDVSDELIAILRVDPDAKKDWKKVTLANICTKIDYGYTTSASQDINGVKFLRITDINNDFINWESVPYCEIDTKQHDKYKLNRGDIVIARTGNSTGATALFDVDIDAVFASYLIRFALDPEIVSPKYISYVLQSRKWSYFVNGISGKSAQDGANAKELGRFEIDLPPLHIQKQIANLLSVFDEKIDLLRTQNKTLEAMAQAHFNHLIYRNEESKWCELQELTDVKRGGSPRPIQDYLSSSGYRWLKISDATATDSPFIFEIKQHIKKDGISKTVKLDEGELVLSNSATPGIPKILGVESCIHDGWLYFPNAQVSNEYLYCLFKELRHSLVLSGNGSVFTNLKTEIVKGQSSPIPSEEASKHFEPLARQYFQKVHSNEIHSLHLNKVKWHFLGKVI